MRKKLIYSGRVVKLFKEKRDLPNGRCTDLEIIEHNGAVLIVPFLDKDKIVVIKQFRPTINSYIYEFPAGTLESGESPLVCAKREIKEEIQYQAGKLTKMGAIYPVPGYSTEKIHIFKAEQLTKPKSRIKQDDDEIIYPVIFTRKQLRSFFENGKIVDAKTICAMAMCSLI